MSVKPCCPTARPFATQCSSSVKVHCSRKPTVKQLDERSNAWIGPNRGHLPCLDDSSGIAVLRAWMDAEAYALSIYRTASRLIAGGSIGADASTNKE